MSFIKNLKNTKINGCKFLLKDIEYKYINDKIYENLHNNNGIERSVIMALLEFNANSEIKYFNKSQLKTFAKNFLNEEIGRNQRHLKRPHGGYNISNAETLRDTLDISVSIEINPMDSDGKDQLHYVCVTKGGKSFRIPCSSKEQAEMISRNYNINSF